MHVITVLRKNAFCLFDFIDINYEFQVKNASEINEKRTTYSWTWHLMSQKVSNLSGVHDWLILIAKISPVSYETYCTNKNQRAFVFRRLPL